MTNKVVPGNFSVQKGPSEQSRKMRVGIEMPISLPATT